MGLELERSKIRGEVTWESSSFTASPLRASSSRAIITKASSTFWFSFAEVSRATKISLSLASEQASLNCTCLSDSRSHLLPARESE